MNDSGIFIAKTATKAFKEIFKKEKKLKNALFFSRKRGECGKGFEHILKYYENPSSNDYLFYSNGIKIYVPIENISHLIGSKINYKKQLNDQFSDLQKLGFFIKNPNVIGDCPCGCQVGHNFDSNE